MLSPSMHSRLKLIAVPKMIWIILVSCAVYFCFLLINKAVYAGIISMEVFLCFFLCSVLVCVISRYAKKQHWKIALQIVALVVVFAEIIIFCLNVPRYSVSEAIDYIQQSSESVTVQQNNDYAVMGTTESLNWFVSKGYVFDCENQISGAEYVLFFNPVSGEYFEIE